VRSGWCSSSRISTIRSGRRSPRSRVVHLYLTPGQKKVASKIRLRKVVFVTMLGVLRILGCRISRVGFSLELSSSVAANATERVLGNSCSLYSPRDYRSVSVARHLGVKDVTWSPDLVTLLTDDFFEAGWPVGSPESSGERRVGVSLRSGSAKTATGCAVEQILNLYRDSVGSAAVIPFGQVRGDGDYSASVLGDRSIGSDLPRNFPVSVEGLFDLRCFYRRSSLVVTDRLHVALVAMMAGCRTVALLGDRDSPKLLDALEALGIDESRCFPYGEGGYAGLGPVEDWFRTMWQQDPARDRQLLAVAGLQSGRFLERSFE
jgi:polysaccharide pyruvyl transferase WcaK-like protein